jgi:hypothetical protein
VRTRALPIVETTPPDIGLYDWDLVEAARNDAYCRELEQRLLDYELDPRNFFRLVKGSQRLL